MTSGLAEARELQENNEMHGQTQEQYAFRPHDGNYACDYIEVSDDDLITAAQRGDHQAFEEHCGRHSSITKTKIFSIVRNHEDAEDALQDTLLRAFTHLSSFRRSCRFSTWLTAIAGAAVLLLAYHLVNSRPAAGRRQPGWAQR